jgi:glutamate/tyrosine decarboxylase-like PLP-dependent enzyme
LGYQVVDILVGHLTELPGKPVTAPLQETGLAQICATPLPEKGTPLQDVLTELTEKYLSRIMHVNHPRFFGFIPSPANYVSALADFLTSGYNVFAGMWIEALGPAEIEVMTLEWVRQLLGMPARAGGLFVSGGSMANLTGLAVARHHCLGNDTTNAVIYFSDQTHSSLGKALTLLGFKAEQSRCLASDAQYRLVMSDLEKAVAEDAKQGKRPFCVIANCGTTNTGAVDPLAEIAAFCHEHSLWFHVDAAYGGAAALTPLRDTLLVGLEKADSLAFDPHKWLFQPYEIGCVMVQDENYLLDTFRVLPEYLVDTQKGAEIVNFADRGIQLTRSFRALKLWMSLKTFGLEAFREAVSWGLSMAEYATELLETSPHFKVIAPATLGIVCFQYCPPTASALSQDDLNELNQALVDAAMADGYLTVTSTILKGQRVIRLCPINPRLSRADLEISIERLRVLGEELLLEFV